MSATFQLHAESNLRWFAVLSLLDSVLLLASGIIGSSIFLTAKDIAGPLPNPVMFLLVWVLGAVISLFACAAFAELGSMFPDSGGQYVYLREVYGDLVAFSVWLDVIRCGNGGTIAALGSWPRLHTPAKFFPVVSQEHVVFYDCGRFPCRLLPALSRLCLFLIVIVTYVNVVGLRWGALLQNLSTWTKFGAMAVFVILGFAFGKGDWSHFHSSGGV